MREQILIVDDDPVISKLLNLFLSDTFEIVNKYNGIDAFRWLEEGNFPALIISDMMMPYLDGSNFVRNLKISGFYRDTPVVVLSGADNLPELINQMPFTVDGYISKPFNPNTLKEVVTNILTTKRSHEPS